MDVTPYVKDGENEIRVQATDDTNADKPRGKQSWTGEKFGCWYTPCTGIWQSVWLEYVGETYLERVKYTPDVDALSALCEIFLSETEDTVVELTATAREGEIFLGSQKSSGAATATERPCWYFRTMTSAGRNCSGRRTIRI